MGQLRSNKPATLYEHPTRSYVVALTGSPDGRGILSAHLDGSVYRFFFDEQQAAQRIVQHPCVPYALAWGDAICCAGSDCKVREWQRKRESACVYDLCSCKLHL